MTIKNKGLGPSGNSTIKIYADDKLVKEIELDILGLEFGRSISLKKVWVNKISVDKLTFIIEHESGELNKANNEFVLQIKK